VESGKQLKRKVKPTKDNYADYKSIQEASDWLRYPIILYNNIYEKIKTFNPKKPLNRYRGIKAYEIQAVGIHCNALVRKRDILKKYPKYVFPELNKIVELKPNDTDTVIKKKKFFHEYNDKFCAWDIETTPDLNGKHIPYACSIAWYECQWDIVDDMEEIVSKDLKEQQFWGLDCLERMTKFIFDNKDIFKWLCRIEQRLDWFHTSGKG
jgi:hypothetical protein